MPSSHKSSCCNISHDRSSALRKDTFSCRNLTLFFANNRLLRITVPCSYYCSLLRLSPSTNAFTHSVYITAPIASAALFQMEAFVYDTSQAVALLLFVSQTNALLKHTSATARATLFARCTRASLSGSHLPLAQLCLAMSITARDVFPPLLLLTKPKKPNKLGIPPALALH